MQRILVTGGAGFIGSHTVERLLARGDQPVVLDNFNDFYDPAIKRANVARFASVPVVVGDIRDKALVDSLFAEQRFDGVIHLAAMAGVRPSVQDPLLYEDVNVRGTMVLLEAARRQPGLRFVFASSSSVYGARDRSPFREDDDIPRPVSPYAATKRAGELIAYTYHHLFAVPVACLRFFTVYGPRQRPEMAIAKFSAAIERGEPIPFYGDGSTRRDYTYIDDIVDGVVAAYDRCQGYEIFNLGESATTSLSELVDGLARALGREARLDRQPLQPGDVPLTCADVSKAVRLLGYAPKVGVDEGLRRYVAWRRTLN
ncbi:MAG: GDP-mannose 4,6-dehydratase [Planctomycetes bacterium]|nr:GDP-mannose 4,6-dehydratase [Planctomycetota bacterium]